MPSWPKILQKHSLEHFWVIIFVIIANVISPEHFLCDVAATDLSLLQENMQINLFWKVNVCNFYKLTVPT